MRPSPAFHPAPAGRTTLAARAIALAAAVPVASLCVCAPLVHAQEPAPTPSPTPGARTEAPNTDACPNSLVPPPPQTTSERLQPGQESPTPPAPAAESKPGACGIGAAKHFVTPPENTASAWLVFDLDSGDVIAQKDPHGRYRPASIIKVLLALTAIDELDLDQQVTVSREAADMEGSSAGLGVTGSYTVRDLLYGLLLASGNDAAQALAEELGGRDATLHKVNDLAHKLGATDTFVADYTGLDKPGQMTSAHDLALMYRAAWQNPTFSQMVATEFVRFPGHHDNDPSTTAAPQPERAPAAGTGQDTRPASPAARSTTADADNPAQGFELWNDNSLFMNDPDGIGGKTGYTDDAHHTFVGALDRQGRRLAAVVLDTTIDKGRAWQQAQRFLHAAYEVPRGEKIATLTLATAPRADTEEPQPAHDDKEAAQDEEQPVDLAISGPAVGILVVCAVLAGVVLAAWASHRRRR
ncbi:D-alanyl-D-alanine carboxypeptidase family protein [Corynebacterium atypicum]|uniref:D-alanyl-D-alanine carboxypeptidase family protein n=1 Tax=Corynebacterium atypicum TaxID=191610 RepID=UPI00068EF95F|nr:serine hydrolase [Corynebacterium atypicum]